MSGKSIIRPSMIQADDVLDRIFKAWVANKIEMLPSDEQYILERMEYADELIRSGGQHMVYKNVVTAMIAKFQNVSSRTLETDIARAKRFFLSKYKRDDKEYARGIRIEWLNKIAEEARENGDYRSAVAALKEGNEILGLKHDDPELPNYQEVQPAPIIVVTNPADIGVPEIPNLEEEIRVMNMPKSSAMKFDSEDIEDAEVQGE